MKEVNQSEIFDNVIDEFKRKAAIVTARKKDGSYNMCTIAWGSIGELWSKDVVTVYVKQNRYTDEFLKEDDYFTVTFFHEDQKDILRICGTKSGRDIDKVKECNLTPIVLDNGITFEGYRRVYLCRKIYQCPFNKDGFVNSDDIINRYYKDEPFHNFYVGEIIKVYE